MTEIKTNYDHVICPGCSHQFRAIPVNVQAEIDELRNRLAVVLQDASTMAAAGKRIDAENTRIKELLSQALEVLKHLKPNALTSFYTIGDREKVITAIEKEGIK